MHVAHKDPTQNSAYGCVWWGERLAQSYLQGSGSIISTKWKGANKLDSKVMKKEEGRQEGGQAGRSRLNWKGDVLGVLKYWEWVAGSGYKQGM